MALEPSNSIGLALTDTLDDLISDERIHPQLAMKILANFDQAITEALQKHVKARLTFKVRATGGWPPLRTLLRGGGVVGRVNVGEYLLTVVRAKGSLDTYRFCDEVWTFLIKNVTFKMDNSSQTVTADKVKIVSCNSKKPGEGP